MIHWLRGLWRYYLAYTKRPLHTATAAAFAIFALLVFVDPLFAALAVVSYVTPPVVLYVLEDEPPVEPASSSDSIPADGPEHAAESAYRPRGARYSRPGSSAVDGDSDSDSDDGDTDSDSDDGDTDTDRVDTDTDSNRSG